jgi:glycosyltransferase involved in cell wall biosynthesis
VVIPTRNEAGNIAAAVEQVPEMGSHTELLFVDGDSTDGTVEKIEELIERYRGVRDIKLIHQVPRGGPEANTGKMLSLGKGDAVRKGFEAASGEVLIILDSDLTVPPQELPKFLTALAENRGELVNGTRLVYQMEHGSMPSACCSPGCWSSPSGIRCAGPRRCSSAITATSSRIAATSATSTRSAISICCSAPPG